MQVEGSVAALLLGICTLLMVIRQGCGYLCHVCNSAPHRDGENCTDTFTARTFLKDCDTFFPNATMGSCRKIVQNVQGSLRVIRQCGREKAPLKCVDRAGTKNIKIKYCHCQGDFCNGVSTVHGTSQWNWFLSISITGLICLAVPWN